MPTVPPTQVPCERKHFSFAYRQEDKSASFSRVKQLVRDFQEVCSVTLILLLLEH